MEPGDWALAMMLLFRTYREREPADAPWVA